MADHRTYIRNLRTRNSRGQYFIPESSLYKYLDLEVIRDALRKKGIEPWKLDELVEIVAAGARKLLGILIIVRYEVLFPKFVEHHQGDARNLDAQLPFQGNRLSFLESHVSEEFIENQWMFIAPIFTRRLTHRYLDDETVLPFSDNLALEKGGFARVFIVKIHAGYQGYDGTGLDCRVVRKELDTRQTYLQVQRQQASKALAKDEHTVLWLLNHLKHPHILELLASYTFQGVHSLLFPVIEGGNLKQFLQSVLSPVDSWAETDYISALAGLTSALEHIHVYRASKIDVSLIGFHQDLKPANVLVRNKDFVLADFGLSTLREGDDSKTAFKVGRGIYKAPECEDYENNFLAGDIGRPMDIWALGCIAMELLVHLRWGPQGVSQFKADRKTEIAGIITTFAFHRGRSPNVGVEKWLSMLESEQSSIITLVSEIRRMLSISPDGRPRVDHISSVLQFLEAGSMFDDIQRALKRVGDEIPCGLRVESSRFGFLGEALGLGKTSTDRKTTNGHLDRQSIPRCISVLSKLAKITITLSDIDGEAALASSLRHLNDDLGDLLPPESRKLVSTKLLQSFIGSAESYEKAALGFTTGHEDQLSQLNPDGYVCKQLAAIQMLARMGEVAGSYDGSFYLQPEYLMDRYSLQSRTIASFAEFHGDRCMMKKSVMIEWITYDSSWIGEVGIILFKRIGRIAQTLRSIIELELLPTMACKGFFHELNRHAFGLVYDLPSSDTKAILSLNTLITTTKDVRDRPSLDTLYHLAAALSASLLELHKIGWLHTNLSSYSILLPSRTQISNFFVCGFNHARPDATNEYSTWLCQSPDIHVLYQHPIYRQHRGRYTRAFDQYALGIVLLELGLWKPVVEMTAGLNGVIDKGSTTVIVDDAEKFRQHILQQFVPLLAQRMGSGYREVVRYCLEEPGNDVGDALCNFETRCVEVLRKGAQAFA